MARQKLVKGELVDLTPAEEAARDAEEAAVAVEVPPPDAMTVEQLATALVNKGVISQAEIDAEGNQGGNQQ